MNTKFLLQQEKDTVAINEYFRVDVMTDSGGQSINTMSGVLTYDPSVLKVESIITGNSLINFWVTTPSVGEIPGTILFSGIIPGGITASDGQIFSVVFSGVTNTKTSVVINNGEMYLNDGNGTRTNVVSEKMEVVVAGTVGEAGKYTSDDRVPPEKFIITRTQDANIFDGKWFVVFGTQDKGSGVAKYDLCESFFKKCTSVESPAVLARQSNFYMVRIKAYDHDGNVRTETMLSPLIIITACVVLAIIAILGVYGVLKRKKIFFR